MSQQKGRTLLFRVGNGGTPVETFTNVCGIRTRSFNLSANEVDTTIPDCNNPGLAVQRTAEPGIVQRSFSGSGAFVSGASANLLLAHVRAGTVFNGQAVVPGDGTYTGPFMCSDFEFTGEMEGNMEFSASFSAAGALAFSAEGVPANALLPSISGIAQVGQTLTAHAGEWSGGAAVFTYQWKNAGVAIPGATAVTYVPVVGDVGDAISVTVTATNDAGAGSATSAATANVIAA